MRKRPAGADSFVKLRRSLDEHLELGKLSWGEFGMLVWLCLKASPRNGTLRTSWPMLAIQTHLSANHVEQLCRALRRKRYVWYPAHRGSRGRLIELAIDKYPTVDGGYTDLSARFDASGAGPATGGRAMEVATDLRAGSTGLSRRAPGSPTELGRSRAANALALTELAGETFEDTRGSPPGRLRREKERELDRDGDARVLRARRAHDARAGQLPPRGEDTATPVAIRELLATQPWWRPSADGRPSPTAVEAGGPRPPEDRAR